MQIYLDTADLNEIRAAHELGVLRGVTTNPSHMYRAGHRDFRRAIQEICAIADVPVSAEVTAPDTAGMLAQAREMATWHPNVVVKMPTTPGGLRAMRVFSREEQAGRSTAINATVVFSTGQAVAASLAGAGYVSPFVGRLDAVGQEGIQLVRDIAEIFMVHDVPTRIISAALRNPIHVSESFKAGAHICTVAFAVLEQLLRHPLTDEAVELFTKDWEKLQAAEAGAAARA
ncbi:MAG TPA: transaldolase family protein [Candidatus Dormibacteraeota bacterium]|nr:transaldolase family protein [Candidatus Dormibacteraeota bacterium]